MDRKHEDEALVLEKLTQLEAQICQTASVEDLSGSIRAVALAHGISLVTKGEWERLANSSDPRFSLIGKWALMALELVGVGVKRWHREKRLSYLERFLDEPQKGFKQAAFLPYNVLFYPLAMPAMLEALEGKYGPQVKPLAEEAMSFIPSLQSSGKRGEEFYSSYRDHANVFIRALAVEELGNFGSPLDAPRLLAIGTDRLGTLRDPVAFVRASAAWALGEIGRRTGAAPTQSAIGRWEAVVTSLAQHLLDETEMHNVRLIAAESLGEIGDPSAVEPLKKLTGFSMRLGDKNRELRQAALGSSAKIITE
jgi:hypothetical protein